MIRLAPAGEVKKSYAGGGKFIRAVDMTKQELRMAPRRRWGDKMATDPRIARLRRDSASNKALFTQGSYENKKMGLKPNAKKNAQNPGIEHYKAARMPLGVKGFATMQGKRKIMVESAHGSKNTYMHETGHLSPKKRKEHRLLDVVSDPKKLAREEARADMHAGNYYRRTPGVLKNNGYVTAAQRPPGQKTPLQDTVARSGNNAIGVTTQSGSNHYRKMQDKIASSKGPLPKDKSRRNHAVNTAITTGVPIAAAGGAIAGLAINDRRTDKKVKKNMATSVWGVDHGDEISKMSWEERKDMAGGAAYVGAAGGGYAGWKSGGVRNVGRMVTYDARSGYKLSRDLGGSKTSSASNAVKTAATGLKGSGRVKTALRLRGSNRAVLGGAVAGGLGAAYGALAHTNPKRKKK